MRNSTLLVLPSALVICGAAVAAFGWAAEAPAACEGKTPVVIAARTPEVDLFDAAQGGKRVSSIPKAKFPTCLAILEQSPARMVKVEIEGTQYWVQPHMVQIRADAPPPVCRSLAGNTADSNTGATRGLGEGC
jgi:hypothetical protein